MVSFVLSIFTGGFHKAVSVLWIFFRKTDTTNTTDTTIYGNQALVCWPCFLSAVQSLYMEWRLCVNIGSKVTSQNANPDFCLFYLLFLLNLNHPCIAARNRNTWLMYDWLTVGGSSRFFFFQNKRTFHYLYWAGNKLSLSLVFSRSLSFKWVRSIGTFLTKIWHFLT